MKRILLAAVIVLVAAGLAEAAGAGHGVTKELMIEFAWRIFNFTIFAAVIFFLARKAVKGYFVGRRDEIRETVEDAERLREKARAKLQEYETRLEKASLEIADIMENIRSQGEAEKEAIIENAKQAAEKMKRDAEARIDQEFKKAVAELKAEATRLSIEMAEDLLKKTISEQDHEAMVNDFLDRMVSRN